MDSDSVREDTGYMRYQLSKTDTYAGKADKIKIEHTQGQMAGKTVTMRRDFAKELINQGKAREVK